MTRDIALRLEDIADASLREDGTDIPLGEQLREAAREILRLRSRVEELEGALKNAEPIAELLRTVSSFLDGWIFADIKPDGEQIQREADGLRTDVDVALAYSPVFSALEE